MTGPAVLPSLAPAQLELLGVSLSLLLFLAGAALIAAEALAPGANFIVLGIALFVAGLVGFLLPPGLGILAPLILAVVVLVTSAVSYWGYQKIDIGAPGRAQTLSSSSLQGQFGTATERVTKTAGQVKLDDGGFNPYYEARSSGDPIEPGSEVLVVDPGGGNVLEVEAVDATSGTIDRALERDREESAAEAETESDHA